jgi:hypothetical protein
MMHCPVDDVPPSYSYADCLHAVSVFAGTIRDLEPAGALLLVLTRPGPASIGATDRQWFRAAHEVCAATGVRLLGVYLATRLELREIVLDDALPR